MAGLILAAYPCAIAQAQETTGDCPCFNSEEAESVFFKVGEVGAGGGGSSNCQVNDYTVEFSGELRVTDANYQAVAQASVKWADFDPGSCNFLDNSVQPAVERNVHWPHPAPEATARACLDILSSVIDRLDTDGDCRTYP